MARLEERVERLESELASIKACLADTSSVPASRIAADVQDPDLSKVLDLTCALFNDPIRFAHIEDPEIPGDVRIVFFATANGEINDILERETEWHRNLCELGLRSPSLYRLSIDAN